MGPYRIFTVYYGDLFRILWGPILDIYRILWGPIPYIMGPYYI